jgi:hypothetical protein
VIKFQIDTSRFETIATEGLLRGYRLKTFLKPDDIISLEDLLHLMIM